MNNPKLEPRSPGIYSFWVDETGYDRLGLPNKPDSFPHRIYLGKSTNLRTRLCWHIIDTHNDKAVEQGFMSTLRQSLHALLNVPLKGEENQELVKAFMSEHMHYTVDDVYDIDEVESDGIREHNPILNANKDTEFGKLLKNKRKLIKSVA